MSQQMENIMKKITLEKVVLNIGVGKSGEPLEIARNALQQIINKKFDYIFFFNIFERSLIVK